MRTQPEYIINQLKIHNSRLDKEAILKSAVEEGLDEFFHGLKMALDKLYTFGVKQVPLKQEVWEETEIKGQPARKLLPNGQGLSWSNFVQLAEALRHRELTGHAARDAIQLAMDVATTQQWNDWYARILAKDLKCGVSEKTVNKVAKRAKRLDYAVPVFECMLAHDSANHESKLAGVKILQQKLDGVRCLTVIDVDSKTVTQFTRNGKELINFPHIIGFLQEHIERFDRSYVLDGEVVSASFQQLMKQVHRKDNVQSQDAQLAVFDILPLSEFKQGASVMGQRSRLRFLENYAGTFADSGCINILEWQEVDLDSDEGQAEFDRFNQQAINKGFEGIMVKEPRAVYECKRSASWLKMKPFIEVTLAVTAVEQGTGRNSERLGALVCEGEDDGKTIRVNVGSGFSDSDRDEFWEQRNQLLGQLVEVRADAVTQNQDGTYSLRFPRFKTFRGFKQGEKM